MENGVNVIEEKNRVVFLDYLRVLATFCVVFIHVSASAIYVFAMQHFNKDSKAITVIAKYSFGVYLSHLIAVEVLRQHIMLNIYEPVKVIIFTVLSFAVAFAISWLVRKLPGGKYIS